MIIRGNSDEKGEDTVLVATWYNKKGEVVSVVESKNEEILRSDILNMLTDCEFGIDGDSIVVSTEVDCRFIDFKTKTAFDVSMSDFDFMNLCAMAYWGSESCRVQIYCSYEYEIEPLCFFPLPELSDEQKVKLLEQYETWYGDTNQSTADYALEFSIVTRMLLNGFIVMNPKYNMIMNPTYRAKIRKDQ